MANLRSREKAATRELDAYDARFVIVTHGPVDEAFACRARVGNTTLYSTANSPFGTDVGACPHSPAGSNWHPSEAFAQYAEPVIR